MARVRVGTVGYLNARPLTDRLDPERYEVVAAHPRGIAAALAAGEVDVALAPVAAVLTDDAYQIVPGWCIGSDGPVHSVAIFAETPPEAWTEVVLDGQSRTSQTLARLLLADGPLAARVRPDLTITEVGPGEAPARLGGSVAALVIGDPARALPDALDRHDLGALWTAWTGKPFVFAVWAARDDLDADVIADLRRAGAEGVATIADRHTGADRVYLTEHIRYPLDEPALMGLRRYAALAKRAGLVGTEHVRLFGPSTTRHPRDLDVDQLLSDAIDGRALAPSEVAALLSRAHETDLGVAADAVRAVRLPPGQATYCGVLRVPADVVGAGGPALDAQLAGAALGEVAAVRLRGLDLLGDRQRLARLDAARAHGLAALGMPLGALGRVARAADVSPAEAAGRLRTAGLVAVDWEVGDAELDAALWLAVAAAGLAVHAHLRADVSPERFAARLDAVRRSARGGAIVSAAVHLPLPVGALVEPDAPTTARWLRALATARLVLPTSLHLSASPATQGVDLSQAALFAGADDLGEVGLGPAETYGGAAFEVGVGEAERVIRVAGLEPVRRDARFVALGGAVTPWRKVRPVAERARA